MREYQVIITKDAVKDIDDIYIYVARKICMPMTASKLCKRITDAILGLKYMPYRYSILEDAKSNLPYRKIIIDNYVIIFLVEENRVIVTNIFYGASNFIEKLKG